MYKLILPLALLAVPTIAAADGFEGSAKDTGYAYSYSVKQQRGSWTCPPEFSRKECSRIRQEVARRQARESRPRKGIVERRIPVYRDTDSRPVRAAFGGKRCIGRVTVTGAQRPTEGLARGAAWKEWRSVVRAMAGGGESYMDDRYAMGERVRCHITGSSRFLKRCEISAIPCR